MEIRVINRNREVINVSRLSIMAEGRYILGKSERKDVVVVEKFESEEEARENMDKMIWVIERANNKGKESLIIDFRDKNEAKEYDIPY